MTAIRPHVGDPSIHCGATPATAAVGFCKGPVVRRVRLSSWLIGAMVVIGGIAIVRSVWGADDDRDRYPPTHQMVVCKPDDACKPRGNPSGHAACMINVTSDRWMGDLPAGTWIYCRKVTR